MQQQHLGPQGGDVGSENNIGKEKQDNEIQQERKERAWGARVGQKLTEEKLELGS